MNLLSDEKQSLMLGHIWYDSGHYEAEQFTGFCVKYSGTSVKNLSIFLLLYETGEIDLKNKLQKQSLKYNLWNSYSKAVENISEN